MITYRKGDILQALIKGEINVLAHGVNCRGGFGSGIAGQIAKKWPAAKGDYHDWHQSGLASLGEIRYLNVGDGLISHCATQDKYGYGGERYVNYDAIYECMKSLQEDSVLDSNVVGLPKIGCGLAGGRWSIVEAIINEVFGETEVFVYEYSP